MSVFSYFHLCLRTFASRLSVFNVERGSSLQVAKPTQIPIWIVSSHLTTISIDDVQDSDEHQLSISWQEQRRAAHLFTFWNDFNLWTLTSARDALATAHHKTELCNATKKVHLTVHTRNAHELCNHQPSALRHYSELVHFLQIRTWPNLPTILAKLAKYLEQNGRRKSIIWNSSAKKTDRSRAVQEKANSICLPMLARIK